MICLGRGRRSARRAPAPSVVQDRRGQPHALAVPFDRVPMTWRRTSPSRQRSSTSAAPAHRGAIEPLEPAAPAEVLLDAQLRVEGDVLGRYPIWSPDGDRVAEEIAPPRVTRPDDGGRKPVSMRIVVVLPGAVGPSMPRISPPEREGDPGDGSEVAETPRQLLRFDHSVAPLLERAGDSVIRPGGAARPGWPPRCSPASVPGVKAARRSLASKRGASSSTRARSAKGSGVRSDRQQRHRVGGVTGVLAASRLP